jgi:hypothetical protein
MLSAGPTGAKGYRLLAPAGLLIAFGLANANKGNKRRMVHVLGQVLRSPLFRPMQLMSDNRAVAGVNMGHLWKETALLRREIDALLDLYRRGGD